MARTLTLEEMGNIAYNIEMGISKADLSKKYNLRPNEVISTVQQYWSRWHELLDIKAERKFNSKETEEYKQILAVVTKLDVAEEEQANELIAKSNEQLRKTKKSFKPLEDVIKKLLS